MSSKGRTDIPCTHVDRGTMNTVENERVKRGLTVKRLCELIGVNAATYYDMIDLRRDPFEFVNNGKALLIDDWVTVLEFLDIDPVDVFGDDVYCYHSDYFASEENPFNYTYDQIRGITFGHYTVDPAGIIERGEVFSKAFNGFANDFESLIEKASDESDDLPRSVRAFILYTYAGLTLDEIGKHKFDASRERVRQLVKEGAHRIRSRFVHRVIVDYNLEPDGERRDRISRVAEEVSVTQALFPIQ